MSKQAIPKFRRLDKKGKIILDKKYILSFSHFDGFTERLLSINLLISKDLELELYLNSFELSNKFGLKGIVIKKSTEDLPSELSSFLEKIIGLNKIELQDNYWVDSFMVDDAPYQNYLFNISTETKNVSIDSFFPLTNEFFKNEFEKHFLEFHLFLKQWLKDIYTEQLESLKSK